MRCISVYTSDFSVFSDVYEQIIGTKLAENEEKVIEGVTFSDAGQVPDQYIEKMTAKREVVVITERERGITILQHGNLFEICLPA